MQVWAALQFAFALVVAIGAIALVLANMHIIERAEEQAIWKELKSKIENIR